MVARNQQQLLQNQVVSMMQQAALRQQQQQQQKSSQVAVHPLQQQVGLPVLMNRVLLVFVSDYTASLTVVWSIPARILLTFTHV